MKNKIIKAIIGIMLILLVPAVSFAADNTCGDNLTWKIENGTLIIGGNGDMTDFTSALEQPWYSHRGNIRSAVIEDGVTSIGKSSFEGLGKLASVQIPDSVKKIGERAFCQCFGLKSIEIPEQVTVIEDNTFCWCKSLSSVSIPDGVVSIGASAFAQCRSLTDITIPNSVENIGKSSFGECANLENVDYIGLQSEWGNILTGEGNDYLMSARINCINPYSILIYTTPYAKVTANGNVYYSGSNGIVRFESTDDVSYTIEKSGYETLSDSKTAVEEGVVINAFLRKNNAVLYAESFEEAVETSAEISLSKGETADKLFSMTAGYGDIKLTADGGTITVANTAKNDFRSVSYPVNVNSADCEVTLKVIFPENAESHILLRDSANQVLGAIHRAADGTATFGATGSAFAGTESAGTQSSPLGTIESGTEVEINISIDVTNGKMIAIVGDRAAGVGNYAKNESGYNDLASIYIGTDIGSEIKISDIVVTEYTGTSAVISELKLNTTPYAKATINGGVYYSGATGKITAEYVTSTADAVCPINYTIEKSGYTTKEGSISAKSGGAELDASLALNDGILYSENFNTVSADDIEIQLVGGDTADGLFGIYAKYGTVKLISDNEKLSVSQSGNGFRSISYPLNINSENMDISMDIAFPAEETNIILRDGVNQVIGAIHRSEEGAVTFGATGMVFNTYNGGIGAQAKSLGTVDAGTVVTVNVKLDMKNGIITAVMGDNKAVISGYKKSAASNGISSVFIGKGRGSGSITIDNLVVKEYEGTTEPITKVKINTTPYAKVTFDNEVYYSGSDGIVEMSFVSDGNDGKTSLYTIEKGGYKIKNGTANITSDGVTIDAVLEPNGGVIYFEDFNTVSESPVNIPLEADTTAQNLFGIYAEYGTINLNADMQKLSIGNSGGGFRSVSYPMNFDTENAQFSVDMVFPSNADSHLLLRDGNNKVVAAIYRAADGETTFGSSENAFTKSNAAIGAQAYSLGNVAADTAVTLTLKFDKENNKITALVGDNTAEAVATAWSDKISTLFIGTARGKTLSMDNLAVKDLSYKTDDTQKPSVTEIKSVTYENGCAVVSVSVAQNDEMNLNIYVAEYDKDKKLVGIKTLKKTLTESEDIRIDCEMASEQNSVAVYVWDNNMIPYCEKVGK